MPFATAVTIACAEQQTVKADSSEAVTAVVSANQASPQPYEPLAPVWDSAFGSFVGYRNGDSTVVILLPSFSDGRSGDTTFDASSVNGSRLDLFGSRGFVANASVAGLGKLIEEDGCFAFSRGHLSVAPVATWSVAFPAGVATGLESKDLSAMSSADSAQLVSQVMQITPLIPGALDPAWKTAPFIVEGAARLGLSDTTVIAASVLRILPGPEHYAQHYFVVGETASGGASGSWRLAYVHPDRSNPADSTVSGLDTEDEVGVAAAVVTKSDSRPVLLLETRGNEVNGYAALGRVGAGRWKVVWGGPHEGGC